MIGETRQPNVGQMAGDGSSNSAVIYEVVEGRVAVVTVNRPLQRNAISTDVIDGLWRAFRRLEADDTIRVGVLTGCGRHAFCAGMDLKEAAATGLRVPRRDLLPVLGDTEHVSKPMIAAVNGAAYAGGCLLAQMCDLCVAAEHSRFAISEAKVGRGVDSTGRRNTGLRGGF